MRSYSILMFAVCTLSCGPRALDPLPPPSISPQAAAGAVVVGRILDAATGLPRPNVYLAVDRVLIASSDSSGWYEIPRSHWWPSGRHEISLDETGYLSLRDTIEFFANRATRYDITLRRAPPPCCQLNGTWEAEFLLDSMGELDHQPTARRINGRLVISDTMPSPTPRWRPDTTLERVTYGMFEVDFTPFFGAQIASDVSTTVMGPTNDAFYRELISSVFAGDSVTLILIPRISHGGVSISGRIVDDSIGGRWHQRAYGFGAYGRVTLQRVP